MKSYTKQVIRDIYEDLVDSALRNYTNSHNNESLKDIVSAAQWAYHFNFVYFDSRVENLLKDIGGSIVEGITIKHPYKNRCVLLDSYLKDNRGLSQQYLLAMMRSNMEILVILTNAQSSIGVNILQILNAYQYCTILSFKYGMSQGEQANKIVEVIQDFSPKMLFLHIAPWDVVALIACHAIRGIDIYNINITDHAFWLGASFIDYNIEFRPYGMTVSLEKRGLKEKQLIAMPYYPFTDGSGKFDGFPDMPDGAIKILTGGALYKMLGKNDIFFHIMERILNISSKVYILVAGFDRNIQFDQRISVIKGNERIIQIGRRKDIVAVFKHIDIYLGTYPLMGGLMSQYAAKYGKPIIAYHEEGDAMNAVEEVVNYNQQDFHTFSDFESMTIFATRLINDVEYRNSQGKLLQEGMMTPIRFQQEFGDLIAKAGTSFHWRRDKIDYDMFYEQYVDQENNGGFPATMALVYKQRLSLIHKLKRNKIIAIRSILYTVRKSSFFYLIGRLIKNVRHESHSFA